MKYTSFFILILMLSTALYPSEKSGIEIYEVKSGFLNSNQEQRNACSCCFQEDSLRLSDKPLLSQTDIKKFDWENQKIHLTQSGKQKLNTLEIPLQGLPVAMVLNGDMIYPFWFWNPVSSFGCEGVYTYPTLEFEIRFGLPDTVSSRKDPRFDARLKQYLKLE